MASAQDHLLHSITTINGGPDANRHPVDPAVVRQVRIVALGTFLFAMCNFIGAVQHLVYSDSGVYYTATDACVAPSTPELYEVCMVASSYLAAILRRGDLVRATGNGAATLLMVGFALFQALVPPTHRLASPSGPAQTTFAVSLVALCCIILTSSFASGLGFEDDNGGHIFIGCEGVAVVCYLAAALRVMAVPGKGLSSTELAIVAFATAFLSKGAIFGAAGESVSNTTSDSDDEDAVLNANAYATALSAIIGALISWASFLNLHWSCSCCFCFRRQGSTAARVLAWLGLAVGCGVTNALWWIYLLNADPNNIDRVENKLGYMAYAAGASCFTASLFWAAFLEYGLDRSTTDATYQPI